MDSRVLRLASLLSLCLAPSFALAQGGPDAYGNISGPIPLDWVYLDGSTGITGADVVVTSNGSADVTLPFSLPWYGGFATVASVSANGGVSFTSGGLLAELNDTIPSAAGDIPDVAVLWDAFDPTLGGSIRSYDDVPTGRFIIAWDSVQHATNVGSASFQLHIYPSGALELHWLNTQIGDALYDDGASATVGIQDALGGTMGSGNALLHSYNAPGVPSGNGLYVGPCGVDVDGDGFVSDACSTGAGLDCDDFDATANPDATEVCGDGIDQDCDGADATGDGDADGYDAIACGGDDCDDSDPLVSPGASELGCDSIDNDCDAGTPDVFDADSDAVACDLDCDDAVSTVFPGATEVCDDATDQDCDGADLLGDADSDGYDSIECGGADCEPDDAAVNPGVDGDSDGADACLDCDDGAASVFPGAAELCDSIDSDCDGLDDGQDLDVGADSDTDGWVDGCGDCDGSSSSVYPGAPEICDDATDQDCDGNDLVGDSDADGYTSVLCLGGGDDCDDGDALVNPGAPEVCDDSIDNDCAAATPDIFDGDNDGADCVADCNDGDPSVGPGFTEICADTIDQDCDGVDLVGDVDGDGYDSAFCGGNDCDDNAANTYPGALEFVCDGVDQACDGLGNEEDADGDGYQLCEADCDDNDPLTWPGAPELCTDGVDNDCDGASDELVADDFVIDDDGALTFEVCGFSFPFCGDTFDSFTLHANGRLTFGDAGGSSVNDGSGADPTSAGSLSDLHGEAPQLAFLWSDLNPEITGSVHVTEDDSTDTMVVAFSGVTQNPGWPGAVLGPNTVSVTFGATGVTTYQYGALSGVLATVGWSCGNSAAVELDLSAPGLPAGVARIGQGGESAIFEVFEGAANGGDDVDLENSTLSFCLTDGTDGDNDGWSDQCGDCDDGDPTVFPGALELCDGADHDCNGVVDDADLDEDGYLSAACGGADCDDEDPDTNPAASEICDGLDNDCDGLPETGGEDDDLDGWLVCGGDCDDGDEDVNPDATELCNEIDDNCDTFIDEGFNRDQDADGTVNPVCGGDDCDDQDATVSPIATEVCDNKDNDCDGVVDDIDLDGDGFLDADCGGDDCNDLRAQVYPGADEACDGNDNDCNGVENDVDLDGDGEIEVNCGGTDCDDGDPNINTNSPEICDDGADNNCNGGTDQGGDDTIADPECTGCNCSYSATPDSADGGWALLIVGLLGALRRRRQTPAR